MTLEIGSMRSLLLGALLVTGGPACAFQEGDDAGAVAPQGGSPLVTSEESDPWEYNEVWLDSCRHWCGAQRILNQECVKGQLVTRGVLVGDEPLPVVAEKSYEVACLDECMNWRGPSAVCWQQQAEANDCMSRDALFICDETGASAWTVIGCDQAGTDPAVCE
ncbi:MAG TPA: hypothetical protein VGK73_05020 [Polyangiaceae bacterium]